MTRRLLVTALLAGAIGIASAGPADYVNLSKDGDRRSVPHDQASSLIAEGYRIETDEEARAAELRLAEDERTDRRNRYMAIGVVVAAAIVGGGWLLVRRRGDRYPDRFTDRGGR